MTLPVPMISLMIFTSRKDIIGQFVSGPLLRFAAIVGTVLIIVLNFVFIVSDLMIRHIHGPEPPPSVCRWNIVHTTGRS
jgi:Mn2+/Fe2+ NRAMP family transporter